MTTLCSYDLNGKKLSFANWISNLSPQETPFTSMTGKESINQTLFQWQTDHLAPAGPNAQVEGAEAMDGSVRSTAVKSNNTQILGKVVKVSDTANALANYGRGRELQYQMEKAGKELKRDLEHVFLNNENAIPSEMTNADGTKRGRKTAGFRGLVAPLFAADTDTGAVVHKAVQTDHEFTEAELFDLTYNLYLAGSRADIIMFHPKHASKFSALQESNADPKNRLRIFEDTPKFSVHVSVLVDPLGQEYKLIPNRWMPEDQIYFFNTSDWTQMVLRAPQRTKLAKDGSYEKWMIEMEVGLRHRHPFASGILDLTKGGADDVALFSDANLKAKKVGADNVASHSFKDAPLNIEVVSGSPITFEIGGTGLKKPDGSTIAGGQTLIVRLNHDGSEEGHWTKAGSADAAVMEVQTRAAGTLAKADYLLTSSAYAHHNGAYNVTIEDQAGNILARTKSVHILVK